MAIEKEIIIKVDTKQATTEIKKVGAETNKTAQEATNLGGKLDSATGGAVARFKGMLTGLKGVATGFKSVGTAIALSGIGLLVVTIAAITAAFKASEEGQNKFAKLMGIIGSVTGNLIDILSDFGELAISVFEDPVKALNNLGDLIKQNIINRVNGLLELLPALGKAISLAFSGEFSKASKVAVDAVGKIGLGIENTSSKLDGLIKGTKEYAAQLASDAKMAGKIADDRARADKLERKLIIERAEAENKVNLLREKSIQLDKFSAKERANFLKEANKITDDIAKQDVEIAKIRANAKVEENKLSKSTKEDLVEEEELKAKVIQLDTARLASQRTLSTQIQSLQKQDVADLQSKIDAEQKIKDDAAKADRDRLDKLAEELNKRVEDDIDKAQSISDRAKEANDLLSQTELETLTNKYKSEKLLLEQSLIDTLELETKYFNDVNALNLKQQAIDDEIRKKKEDKDKAAIAEKDRLNKIQNQAVIDTASTTFGLLSSLSDENSSEQKAFAAAQALINTYEGISAGVALGYPAAIPAVIAAATTGFAAVKNILSTKNKVTGGVPSGVGGNSVPVAPPSFNLVQGTGSNQIAEGLASETRPIKAYVVGTEITTQQSLDRNIVSGATLGG